MIDIEVLEFCYFIMVREYLIRKNLGGVGYYVGGNGVICWLEFCVVMSVVILFNYRWVVFFGVVGGLLVSMGENLVECVDGIVERFEGMVEIQMYVGDVLVVKISGGGGFGVLDVS